MLILSPALARSDDLFFWLTKFCFALYQKAGKVVPSPPDKIKAYVVAVITSLACHQTHSCLAIYGRQTTVMTGGRQKVGRQVGSTFCRKFLIIIVLRGAAFRILILNNLFK